MIVIDPLRADELPCYGYNYNTAPNICRFANKNILFTNAYSQSSWTLPSIMSLMTSRFPSAHGMVIPYTDVLAADIPTLPQQLKKSGYTTIFLGDTDNSHLPLPLGLGRGFDQIISADSPDRLHDLLDTMIKNDQSHKPIFAVFHTFDINASWRDSASPPAQFTFEPFFTPPFIYDTKTVTNRIWKGSIEYLSQFPTLPADIQNITKQLTHATSLSQAASYFALLPKNEQQTIALFDIYNRIDTSSPLQMRYLRNLYDERILKLDNKLAPIFDRLSQSQLSSNTIVLLTSDHGEEFGEHGKISHGTNLYAPTTHIPLILRIPTLSSKRITNLVQSIDIFPTILTSIGVKIPSTVFGHDLLKPLDTIQYAIGELGSELRSVRTLEWSLYIDTSTPSSLLRLFQLSLDPNEVHNVLEQ